MSTDGYRDRLKKAAWTWREDSSGGKRAKRHKKDRVEGRHDKRSARNEDRREIQREIPRTRRPR